MQDQDVRPPSLVLTTDVIVTTDFDGCILDASTSAGAFLGLSPRNLVGRNLVTFFCEDRPGLLASLTRLAYEDAVQGRNRVQRRDRRPLPVQFAIRAERQPGTGDRLRWQIRGMQHVHGG